MLKSKETGLSKSWSVVKRQGASYTGGPISVSKDGAVAACMCNDHAALLDVQTGAVLKFLPPEVRAACPGSLLLRASSHGTCACRALTRSH